MMRWRTRTHLNAMPRRGIAKRRLDGVCTIMYSSPLSRTINKRSYDTISWLRFYLWLFIGQFM